MHDESTLPMEVYNSKINFTAVVVTYNEERYLRNCLNSLAFCEQLVMIDLGSTDSSVEVAKQCGAEVKHHEKVPVVEQIRKEATAFAKNDWIIYLDPDEILPANIEDELYSQIMKNPDLGVIAMPWQFYFKGKLLNFTIWGMKKTKSVLFHKNRNKFISDVHRGAQLLDGYIRVSLPTLPNYYIKHYWVDSYRQLFKRHWRYIKKEGESRWNQGERFSLCRLLQETIAALKFNLFDYKGVQGGFRGVFLSIFYTCYVGMSLLSLRRYQKCVEKTELSCQ